MLLCKGAGGHPPPLESCHLEPLREVLDGGRARGEAVTIGARGCLPQVSGAATMCTGGCDLARQKLIRFSMATSATAPRGSAYTPKGTVESAASWAGTRRMPQPLPRHLGTHAARALFLGPGGSDSHADGDPERWAAACGCIGGSAAVHQGRLVVATMPSCGTCVEQRVQARH